MGWLASAMPSSVAPPPARPKCWAFPTAGCVVLRVTGTVPGSDSLCPGPDFGLALYGTARPPTRPGGRRTGGPPLLTPSPSGHAESSTPGSARARSKFLCRAMGFTKSTEARRSRPKPFDAAVFASCFGLSSRHLLLRREHGASAPGSLPTLATCYGAAWPLPRRVLPPLAMEPFAGRTWIQA